MVSKVPGSTIGLVKDTGITAKHAKSVKEYSCMEDSNLKFRPYMEDRYCCVDQYGGFTKQGYFAVFDGHGGKEIAEYCASRMHDCLLKLLKEASVKGVEKCLDEAFLTMDSEVRLLDSENTGTTACIAFITIESKERVCYIANVGDTRAVIGTATGVERLTYEHRAADQNEIDRIQKMGGFLMAGRVGGQLAITRSIGDHSLRGAGVIPNPSIKKQIIRPTDKWLIIATDGVWDSLTEKDIEPLLSEKDEPANKLAQKIIKASLEKGSKDNITCLAIKL